MQNGSPIARQLQDYRLTTAEIVYRLPDHPALLQTYVWQELDLAPTFPELAAFLRFWRRELEGPLHSVRVRVAQGFAASRWQHRAATITLQ